VLTAERPALGAQASEVGGRAQTLHGGDPLSSAAHGETRALPRREASGGGDGGATSTACVTSDGQERRLKQERANGHAQATVRGLRPRLRRAARTLRPPLVDMRARNPCVFLR